MSDDKLQSQTEQHTNDEKEREIYERMRDDNAELLNNFFSFQTVLLTALVLGTIILVAYGLNAFIR